MRVPQYYGHLADNVANQALWDKVVEGFKYISGSGWEARADYRHFWTLVEHLYALAHGPKAKLPATDKLAFATALSWHAGRVRKGIRTRPYFHHILMVVYLAWLVRLPADWVRAAIHHDDVEDVPKHLVVPVDVVMLALRNLYGSDDVLTLVEALTNTDHPDGKHAGQLGKMAKVDRETGTLKLLDRVANLYDLRQDKPKGKTPAGIALECERALELMAVMPEAPRDEVQALLVFAIRQLQTEHSLPLLV
jgi:hypothetical protein